MNTRYIVRVLQCGAMCCSLVQCVAVWCKVLQRGAMCCSVVQCVAACCSVLQCGAVWCSVVQCGAMLCMNTRYIANKHVCICRTHACTFSRRVDTCACSTLLSSTNINTPDKPTHTYMQKHSDAVGDLHIYHHNFISVSHVERTCNTLALFL